MYNKQIDLGTAALITKHLSFGTNVSLGTQVSGAWSATGDALVVTIASSAGARKVPQNPASLAVSTAGIRRAGGASQQTELRHGATFADAKTSSFGTGPSPRVTKVTVEHNTTHVPGKKNQRRGRHVHTMQTGTAPSDPSQVILTGDGVLLELSHTSHASPGDVLSAAEVAGTGTCCHVERRRHIVVFGGF
jgi:hypothetical protein